MAQVVPLDKFADQFGEFAKVTAERYKVAVVDALLRAIPRLAANSPVDTGLFAQSWDLQVDEKQAVLGNYAPHAPIIEFGARPFTPPIGPLLAWAKRVLRQPEINDTCWALAKYTQAKIAREGMKPRHILTNELDHIMNDLKANLQREMNGVQ